jgi:hypothetical protein
MRILICGDRRWTDKAALDAYVAQLPADAVVITGGARGADTMAFFAATARGMKTIVFVADWKRYGRAAGPIRNRRMLEARPDVVAYAHDDLESSKGTKNMVELARKAGVSTENIRDAIPGC